MFALTTSFTPSVDLTVAAKRRAAVAICDVRHLNPKSASMAGQRGWNFS